MGRTAVGGVPAGDYGGSSNIRERWQIFEEVVALGYHAVETIRTRNNVERVRALVINGVPGDLRGANGERRGEESDGRDKLHVCSCRKAKALFAGVSGTTTSLSFYSFWAVVVGAKRRAREGMTYASTRICWRSVRMTLVESTKEYLYGIKKLVERCREEPPRVVALYASVCHWGVHTFLISVCRMMSLRRTGLQRRLSGAGATGAQSAIYADNPTSTEGSP